MPQLKLTADILSAALEGFEAQNERIDARIAEIKQLMDGSGTGLSSDTAPPRQKVSAASRRRMARAQRLRWKKVKQSAESKPEVARPKRKLSAAARKRIAVAQRKRWAAIKKASVAPAAVSRRSPANLPNRP
jgi:hypothetical protein